MAKKKRTITYSVIATLLIVLIIWLYTNTGFFQKDAIDVKDSLYWEFEDNIIKGAKSITIEGSSGECWVMAHGYASTPDELKILGEAINKEYNDTIYIPRLKGHGMLPSNLLKYSIDDWYDQIASLAQENSCNYLVGSSLTTGFAIKYAEEHSPKAIVLLGTYLKAPPDYLPMSTILKSLYITSLYLKKDSIGTIEDPEGLNQHISTWHFPLKAAVEYDAMFLPKIIKNSDKITAKVLFIHPKVDKIASKKAALEFYNNLNSEKLFVELDGNHLIMRDIDKEKAIQEVLNFRKR